MIDRTMSEDLVHNTSLPSFTHIIL